jgi:hypothetical protein
MPLHTILLAAYAVLFVYASNISEVLFDQVQEPLLMAIAGATVVLLVCALLFRDLRRGALLATTLVATFMFFGHVSFPVSESGLPEVVQLAIWALLIVSVAIYARRERPSTGSVTVTLNAFALILVVMSLLTIVPTEADRAVRASEGEAVVEHVSIDATKVPDRDIYFIDLDRYGSDWALKEAYGIDNDIYPYLESVGFQVVPGARANYRASDLSLGSTLNMRYMDELTETYGRDTGDRSPARELLARHDVGTFLRQHGYRYYHLGAWWEGTRSSPIADEVLSLGKTAEFGAVLREGTILPAVDRLLGNSEKDTPSRAQHRDMAQFAIRQIQHLARTPGRKFVFAHILLPHPPYVLAEGGRHVLKEEVSEKSEPELFAQQLRYTNEAVKRMVSALLEGPEETDPIIILSADEGPYLCGDVDCVDGSPEVNGIRYGVLRAYYLPGVDVDIPADDSGVNIFRLVLREYFGADLPDLPNRSYTWPDNDHLYDFEDITDTLPLPGAAHELTPGQSDGSAEVEPGAAASPSGGAATSPSGGPTPAPPS